MLARLVAPWLALLLFDQNDPPPSIQNLTVNDLIPVSSSGTLPNTSFFPTFVIEPGQQTTDAVTAIDIPLALFNAIAPSQLDMNWMAHVRSVDIVAKATVGDSAPSTDYSVVFGNRLPTAGNIATVHLVSFENFGAYLPNDDGTNLKIAASYQYVRVVSLMNWTFTAFDLQQDFENLLLNLNNQNQASSGIQLPYNSNQSSGDPAADNVVENAFGMGYTAMNHTLRDGSNTVSWYRGPLLPLSVTTNPLPASDSSSYWTNADQLLRFDPSTAMFDVSYSSAWQLGRMLALQNKTFAVALYRWKQTQTQQVIIQLEQSVIDQQLPEPVQSILSSNYLSVTPTTNHRHARMTAVIKGLVGPAVNKLNSITQEAKKNDSTI